MKLPRWAWALVFCSALLPLHRLHAQPLAHTLRELQDTRDSMRARAFYRLLGLQTPSHKPFRADERTRELLQKNASTRDSIAGALIVLLEHENAKIHAANSNLTEDYSGYHGDLILAVSALRDTGAIGALVGALDTGWGAADGLLQIGAPAILPAIKALEAPDRNIRVGATNVLGRFAEGRGAMHVDSAALTTIRKGLLGRLHDTDPGVRAFAVSSLTPFRDAEVRKAIQRLANERPLRHDTQWTPSVRRTGCC